LEQIQGDGQPQPAQGEHYSNPLSQLQYYSTEAANSIRFANAGLSETRDKLEHAGRPASMIRQLSDSIGDCTQTILQTIETEREVLQTISRDVDEIASIENHAAFTSNLITSASDELLYLSKLLSSEVQRFHTTLDEQEESPQTAS
jgi:methyl-accepting chemotaxis protein